MKCARWSVKHNEAIDSDRLRIKGNFVRRVFLWTFEERCQRLIAEAVSVLENYDFSVYEEVVLFIAIGFLQMYVWRLAFLNT